VVPADPLTDPDDAEAGLLVQATAIQPRSSSSSTATQLCPSSLAAANASHVGAVVSKLASPPSSPAW